LRQFQQVTIEAIRIERLGIFRPIATIDRGDAFLHQRCFDFDVSYIHVQGVGFDAALNDTVRQHDSFGSEALYQGLRNDAAAVIAAGGAPMTEVARLKEIHFDG
jgi:hypothetical protein